MQIQTPASRAKEAQDVKYATEELLVCNKCRSHTKKIEVIRRLASCADDASSFAPLLLRRLLINVSAKPSKCKLACPYAEFWACSLIFSAHVASRVCSPLKNLRTFFAWVVARQRNQSCSVSWRVHANPYDSLLRVSDASPRRRWLKLCSLFS